jgi:cytochrome c peroxidase
MKIHLIHRQVSFHLVIRFLLPLFLLCSISTRAEENTSPRQLIVHTLSADEISLSWQAPLNTSNTISYRVFRDGSEIATTTNTSFLDNSLNVNTRHSYHVTTVDSNNTHSEPSNTDSAKTLLNADNDGLRNGAGFSQGGMRLSDACPQISRRNPKLIDIPAEDLDDCLDTAIEHYALKRGLEDMRAFTARLRRQEDPMLIDLGMRLFHSKTLSQNNDTACSSCHHPALSCGSDSLSLSIGVNADNPDLLGLGRSDGNTVPLVARSSPHICNSALWVKSMFWDQRVGLQEANRVSPVGAVSTANIRTPERAVTNIMRAEVDNTDPLRLLIAQAHFPVTAAAEMGDTAGFGSPQDYRKYITTKFEADWSDKFSQTFGSNGITFPRITRALAAYEASYLFIDNPFFNYIDGDSQSLNEEEKRGALFFYAGAGCANCHDGVFFSPEKTRGPLYPQIGVNAGGDGNDKNQFRMPSLLNVGITAPYGDKGVFATLERVIQHYSDTSQSLVNFYHNNEVCDLPQFQHLSADECTAVAGDGEAHILALNAENRAASDRGNEAVSRNFSAQEIDYLAAFLRSLTDKSALPGSNEINLLIPPRDGGPDGNQLDAVDKDGNAL